MSKPRILLGMSGGTDSSVAVLLLQDAGYEVVGTTLRLWEETEASLQEVSELAQKMKIEHHIIDARTLFKETIVNYFINEYLSGRTPVPCVVCNNLIKWHLLEQKATELNIALIATGHYAQIEEENGVRYITKGIDEMKDQSFFLWGLKQPLLSKIILPLGKYKKTTIREIASQRGFHKVASRPDSMGICFCPTDYRIFLKSMLPPSSEIIRTGNFVDEKGNFLGRHKGYPFYTVGQRRGLGVTSRQPLYVQAIDPTTNSVTLTTAQGLQRQTMELYDWNIAHDEILSSPVVVRYRYDKHYATAHIERLPNNHLLVKFSTPVMGVAPGQAACLYQGDRVVGGGFIA